MLPDFDLKDRIKQATNIVDLIGSDMQLRRQGGNYVGLCPWHDDTKPSFQINESRQSWACWVCADRGDVFSYVMKRDSLQFREALEYLADRAGIPMTKFQQNIPKGSVRDKNTLFKAIDWVQQQYHKNLLESADAVAVRDYLSDRGITDESIDQFKIGFAPLAWSWLVDRARSTEFSGEILEACNVVMANNRGGYYERFRGRVLFPIHNLQQKTIGFGGRVVPGIYGTEEEPKGKYVNTSETLLFTKSDNLYGLSQVYRDVQKTRKLTIVEGYTDVIAAYQAGLRNTVAVLGTALNERHIKLIKRFADSVTLVLDGDEAGQKRTNQILDIFVAQDMDLRILSLPEGLDPFDYVQNQGADAFQSLVDAAPDALAHKIGIETAGIDLVNDTHAANQALENILKTIAQVPTSVIAKSAAKSLRQDQLVARLARQFQTTRDQVKGRLKELRNSTQPARWNQGEQDNEQNNVTDFNRFDLKEVEVLELIFNSPELADIAIERVSPGMFGAGPLREIFELLGEFFHDGRDANYENVMLHLDDPNLKNVVEYLLEEATQKQAAFEAVNKGVVFDAAGQLETVIQAFHRHQEEVSEAARISQLHEKKMDKSQEATALEELLRQTRQRQGITAPTDG